MKRQAAVLSAALAVIVVGIAVASSNAQQPGPPTGTLELVLRDRESTFKFVDNPPRGGDPETPSLGDLAIIGGTLRDTSNRRVGKVHALFMRLKGRRKNIVDQVSATFVIKGGQIVVAGVSHQRRVWDMAITGGTATTRARAARCGSALRGRDRASCSPSSADSSDGNWHTGSGHLPAMGGPAPLTLARTPLVGPQDRFTHGNPAP